MPRNLLFRLGRFREGYWHDNWTLCNRSDRSEAAAEIVKKMTFAALAGLNKMTVD
jgi:hypothetical protein